MAVLGGIGVEVDVAASPGAGDLTPAAALFQVPRVARARNLPEEQVKALAAALVAE